MFVLLTSWSQHFHIEIDDFIIQPVETIESKEILSSDAHIEFRDNNFTSIRILHNIADGLKLLISQLWKLVDYFIFIIDDNDLFEWWYSLIDLSLL